MHAVCTGTASSAVYEQPHLFCFTLSQPTEARGKSPTHIAIHFVDTRPATYLASYIQSATALGQAVYQCMLTVQLASVGFVAWQSNIYSQAITSH